MKIDVQHAIADPHWTPALLSRTAMTRFASAAEECGYAALGFTDHPAPSAAWANAGGEGSIDLFSALGFCAAITSNIRLLTFVLVLPYRNPLLAAHQTASLDVLSDGRLTVGVGTGYLRGEFRALAADFNDRRNMFDAAVETLKAYWSGEQVSLESPPGRPLEVAPRPLPVQRPGPPMWIHGNSAWGRDRAARYGDGWFGIIGDAQLARTMRTSPIADIGALGDHIDDLRARIRARGRDPHSVEVAVAGLWPMLDVRRGWDHTRMRDQLETLSALGVDRILVTICGDDVGAAEDTVRRFGEEMIAKSPTAPANKRAR